jgi:hypothetical protein
VLDHVRDRLRNDGVGARLDLWRQPLGEYVDVDGEEEALDEGAYRAAQPSVCQGRRQNAVRQVAELAVALLRMSERLAQQRLELAVVVSRRFLSQLERHDRVHQALLCAVVKITHHSSASVVGRREQARPRSDELLPAVGVGDRCRHQLGGRG